MAFSSKISRFTLCTLVVALNLSGLSAPVFAQSSEGWQDLETFTPPAETANDGWRDLDDYQTGSPSPTVETPTSAAAGSSAVDGWQDIESLGTGSGFEAGAAPSSSDWVVIEDALAAGGPSLNASSPDFSVGLSAGDLIDIYVANADNLGGTYRISTLGTLVLPLIGSVDTAGLSPDALEATLEQRYGVDYLVNPEITVTTREKILGNVKLAGLIGRPGNVSLSTADTLSSLLTKGGGALGSQSTLDAIILRNLGSRITARRMPLAGTSAEQEPRLIILPGDQITVLQRKELPKMENKRGDFPLLDTVLGGGALGNF